MSRGLVLKLSDSAYDRCYETSQGGHGGGQFEVSEDSNLNVNEFFKFSNMIEHNLKQINAV